MLSFTKKRIILRVLAAPVPGLLRMGGIKSTQVLLGERLNLGVSARTGRPRSTPALQPAGQVCERTLPGIA